MIHTIKIRNYQSIRDEVVLDFTVGKQAPRESRYADSKSLETRTTLVQAFVGANASGKTTALKALEFVRWFMVRSFREDNSSLPLSQFACNSEDGIPTSLEVVFEAEGEVHVYRIALTNERVLKEELYIRSRAIERVTDKRLLEREWDASASEYKLVDNIFGLTGEYWKNESLGNSSIVAAAHRIGSEYATKLFRYWRKVETNIELEDRFAPYQIEAYMALRYYANHPESREIAEKDIKKYDLGIDSLSDNNKIRHKNGDRFFELSIEEESSGTQQILVLQRMIHKVLENGGVAIIDELNAYLHPLIVKAIVGKFLNKEINKGNGQLLFSTHDIYVLDYLEKYEITLMHKNKLGVTTAKRLDSYPGVRNTDNFKKKYLEGEYDAIPELI